MKTKYAVNWTQVIDAVRSAGALMFLQGLVFWPIVESPVLISWARGSALVGLLKWAGASLAKQRDC